MSSTTKTQPLTSYADKAKMEPQPDLSNEDNTNTNSNDGNNADFFVNTKGQHSLNDSWVLWFHEMNSDDWSQNSYRRLASFSTVEEFWGIYNHLPSIVNGMWFLMRKEYKGKPIFPLWEDPAVVNGGAWLFKIHKSQADNVWLDLSELLVGETICKNSEEIVGLSISPKKHYVTIRVWNRDKNNVDTSVFPTDIPHVHFNEAIYKPH